MKTCPSCKEELPIESFNRNKSRTDGRDCYCRKCKAKKKAPYKKPPMETRRSYNLKFFFGLTIEQYDEILAGQGGKCAACPALAIESERNFPVDHDHSCCPGKRSCGKCVRGILCKECNTALGLVGDSVERLEALAEYLRVTNML